MSVTISHTARSYPRLPFEKVKNDVLGRQYQLSLVFVGEKRGAMINKDTRQKTYSPNVLSFPLSKTYGEIYITPTVAKREAKRYDHTYSEHVLYLFIHGLLHLKGLDHGTKMDSLEQKYLDKYRKIHN